MKPVAAIFTWTGKSGESGTLESLKKCELISEAALVSTLPMSAPTEPYTTIRVPSLWSKSSVVNVLKWFDRTKADYLLWIWPGAPILDSAGLQRLWSCARDTGASIVYSDYFDQRKDGSLYYHPLIDYQLGSLRDNFDFGSIILLSRKSLSGLIKEIEDETPSLQYGGLYDLRLRLSERGPVLHLPEPIYQLPQQDKRPSNQKGFDYVDPTNRNYQLEMEKVASGYLQRIGALLEPPRGMPLKDDGPYPVKASVVIPVKNRARTIADAIDSALSQITSFDYNVIVVDNHSNDGTTAILTEIAQRDRRLIHLIPKRKDLGIGGCWNEAIYSKNCGRVAVQLDSDDLYDGTEVLERMVREFAQKLYALVIGAYTIVNFELDPLYPGLIDHREWTDSNGHNNALRIAGLGAPRAFHVPTLRRLGFPNVSYGEDYAVVLQLCRTYRVGRIYDSLYWCRRWEGNTDSSLPVEVSNRYDTYKDRIRTIEIAARKRRENV